jgi:hypothetical protein
MKKLIVAIVLATTVQGSVVWVPPVLRSDPVIQVDTPEGLATVSGPGAEWLIETGFPIVE